MYITGEWRYSMLKKIKLIENIVFIVNVLILISVYIIKFSSDKTEYVFLAIALAIMVLSNMLVGVIVVISNRLWTWKTVTMLSLYVLQIILYILLIISKGSSLSHLICALALITILITDKLLPLEYGNVHTSDLPS